MSDDIFIVGFPKSGNTWVRFLLGNYLTDCSCDFTNSYLVIPEIEFAIRENFHFKQSPRLIHSHMPYTPDYPKVIYIIRDGRDVAASYFFYLKKLGEIDDDMNFSSFLRIYLKNGIQGFGSWADHVAGWLNAFDKENLLIIKYEDLLKATEIEFRKMIEFAGLDFEIGLASRAIKASSFKVMQNLEVDQHDECPTLKNISNKKIRFVREGQSGYWSNIFSKYDEEIFLNFNKETLHALGYL